MNHHFRATQSHITRVVLILAVMLLALASFGPNHALAPPRPVIAATNADCIDGNVPTPIEVDMTLSGDLFVTGNVTVRAGATLTLTAGTHITMCGPYELIFNNGALHAEGTLADPITIVGETPATGWGRVFFNGAGSALLPSTLRHVILDGGGGSNPAADWGTLHIYDANISPSAGPVVEHVTIRNSGAYGVFVRVPSADTTPPLLSSLTITNSTRAPMLFWASALGGLGTGNTFNGNSEEAIEVRAGTVLGGDVRFSQTWERQPVPYRMATDFGTLSINGATTPTLTLTPGTIFRMDPDFEIRVAKAHLIAAGTPEDPITFEPVTPGQPWRGIVFNGSSTVVPTSTLRHVILDGGGGSAPPAEAASLELYAPSGTEVYGPVFDAITIRNSSAYGLWARVTETDDTPMLASNLTITGSARSPIRLWAASVGGLGEGNTLTGNADDAIEVVATGLGGSLDYDATWQAQPVPYRLLNLLTVSHARSPLLTIAAGTTVEMTATAGIKVNSGGLLVEGAPATPITITRAPGAATWDRLYFEANINPASRLSFVTIEHAGGVNGAIDFRGVALTLNHVTVRHATNAGLYTRAFAQVTDSLFEQNGEGVRFQYGAWGVLRRNIIQDNGVGITVLNNSGNACIDAMGNYWGSEQGPADAADILDACNLTTTNVSPGNSVSRDVLYRPWLSEAPGEGAIDASRIAAEDFWIIADGVHTTTLTITARDAQGSPLVGKQIALETTRGTIRQPTTPTDARGVTTAVISSTQTGAAQVTAFNITDERPLAALASLSFWQGQGDNAGLIPPTGSPYATPRLIIEGRPFEQGLPMVFRLPMQNTQAVAIEVQVVYSVSRLNIGARFSSVYTTSITLQPGETWDAEGIWIPTVTGHHCVKAEVTVTLPDGEVQIMSPLAIVNVGPFQVNLDFIPPDPCKKLDVNRLIPRSLGLTGARKHFQKALIQAYLVNACIQQGLGGSPPEDMAALGIVGLAALRDYEIVAPPPQIAMPQLAAGDGVSQAEADAANAVGDTTAELIALDIALATARLRAEQAGQAEDAAAISRQTDAYRSYQQARGAAFQRLAARLNDYLILVHGAGIPDTPITPADYADYLTELLTVGYDAETIDFHRLLGRSDDEIQTQLELEIIALKNNPLFVTSFYTILAEIRDAAAARGALLQRNYGSGGARMLAAAQSAAVDGLYLGTLTTDFAVGNPKETAQTVNLIVNPVQLPLDWTYRLSAPSVQLGPGETTTVTLTIDVGHAIAQDSQVRISVEGYIGAELIGGILFEQEVPAPARKAIYLPLVLRSQN